MAVNASKAPSGGKGSEPGKAIGTRNVLFTGLVSLFTDLSSEMIYPLVPAFLRAMGVSMTTIGVIEGVAESTASLLRTVTGRLSDKLGKQKAFMLVGYGLSTFSKPFLFLATGWPMVLGVRFADRVGKAIRTPARDALLSTSVDGARKGWAFGVHRGMDRLGAVGGPLLALLVLHLFKNVDVPSLAPAGTGLPARLARHLCMLGGNKVRLVFLFSFIPAALALAFIPFTREAARAARASSGARRSGLGSPAFVLFLVASIVFTLGNSSNAFLILKAREAALPVTMIPVIWVVYNITCTISSPIFGTLSDRVGRAPVIAVSFIYYAIIYALFGFTQSLSGVWTLFAAYGLYYGLSEGVFRAYIADLVAADYRATAYGVFNTGVGLALVPASVIFGAVWDAFGSKWAFLMSAAFSLVGFVIFLWGLTAARRARGAGQPG